MRDAKVLLFKGQGGRDLLAQTLAARGATVMPVEVYRRLPPSKDFGEVLAQAGQGGLSAVVLSSSEAVRHFGALIPSADRAFLDVTPVFCPHPRIAEAARAIGCRRVVLAESGDAGILAALSTYNWSST
jgi:uroporphyrinogen-III synthase